MSHRRHRLTKAFAGALALTAIAAPNAGALPAEMVQGSADPGSPSSTEAPAPTVTRTIDDGFDWGSFAIGAGAVGATVLIAASGATAVSHRRHRIGVAR
jgi:hypothetical protein